MKSLKEDEKLWRYLGGHPPTPALAELIATDPSVAHRLAELAFIECALREESSMTTGRRLLQRRRLFLLGGVVTMLAATLAILIGWTLTRGAPAAGIPMAADGSGTARQLVAEMHRGETIRVPNRPMKVAFTGEETVVAFSANSEVRFDESPGRGKRVELYSGGLSATVSPQRSPFKVVTPHLTVEVLGTAFDVQVSAQYSEILVEEGVVEVTAKSRREPLRLAAGSGWRQQEDGRGFPVAAAAYAERAPSVDANDDSLWDAHPAIPNIFPDTEKAPDSESDHSSHWKAVWNDKALYLLVEVLDTEARNDNAKAWANDSVEVFIDADESRAPQFDGINDHFLFFEPGSRVITPGVGALQPSQDIDHHAQRTRDGFRVEISLPWESLGIEPRTGLRLGLNIATNDADPGENARSQLSWTPKADRDWSRPDRMGTLILVKPN